MISNSHSSFVLHLSIVCTGFTCIAYRYRIFGEQSRTVDNFRNSIRRLIILTDYCSAMGLRFPISPHHQRLRVPLFSKIPVSFQRIPDYQRSVMMRSCGSIASHFGVNFKLGTGSSNLSSNLRYVRVLLEVIASCLVKYLFIDYFTSTAVSETKLSCFQDTNLCAHVHIHSHHFYCSVTGHGSLHRKKVVPSIICNHEAKLQFWP
ncbi:hypothetical protein F5879DRAFT_318659 [Lentinula edodes]|nr:hypothetical protein F5879DRAFT_318659 [Lentinula edodes]